MKTLKLEIPEGYEIDEDKSTFSEIVFKKKAAELPKSVDEIPNRKWYITGCGQILTSDEPTVNDVSSKERAEAFLALMQLVELRDAWNGDWSPDYTDWKEKWSVACSNGEITVVANIKVYRVLAFKSREIAEEFLDTFKDLIETAKELI